MKKFDLRGARRSDTEYRSAIGTITRKSMLYRNKVCRRCDLAPQYEIVGVRVTPEHTTNRGSHEYLSPQQTRELKVQSIPAAPQEWIFTTRADTSKLVSGC
jgi:hypothetical protein